MHKYRARDFNTLFNQIFLKDRDFISDDQTDLQRQINLEHNVRNLHKMDTRRVTDERIVETSDLQQLGAIAARQL